MKYNEADIEQKLQEYPALQSKLHMLQYELQNPPNISSDELLNAMATSTSKWDQVIGETTPYDKTLTLVESYQKKTTILNAEVLDKIVSEMNSVRRELERMDLYIGLLTEDQQYVLRAFCIERRSWRELEVESGYSRRTLRRRKTEGIVRLTDMFNYTGRFMDNLE